MKRFLLIGMPLLGCFLLGVNGVIAQSGSTPPQAPKVKTHTVLAQYAPDLVVPATERREMKQDRLALIRERRAMLDTLEMSRKKKLRLLRELYLKPAGEHWDHLYADLILEEESPD